MKRTQAGKTQREDPGREVLIWMTPVEGESTRTQNNTHLRLRDCSGAMEKSQKGRAAIEAIPEMTMSKPEHK